MEEKKQEEYPELISPAPVLKQWFIKSSSEKIQDHYTISEKDSLGQGTYGTVVKAVHLATNQLRAIKIIPKTKVSNPERFRTEIEILKTLDHPNIIKLFETFEDLRNIYLVMEICQGGELFDRITSKGSFSEKEARHAFVQIISAINYCHLRKIAHRDLKPENFLYLNSTDTSPLKVIDFGLSKIYGDPEIMVSPLKLGKLKEKVVMKTRAGTPYYIAPEVLDGYYDEACDVWSAGVILYIMLCGYPPFYGDDDREILLAVKRGAFDFQGSEWACISNEAKDLIKKCLTRSEKRLRAYEVLAHKWIKLGQEKKKITPSIATLTQIEEYAKYDKLKKSVLVFLASQLSEQEIGELKNLFFEIDKDDDGILSIDEFTGFVRSLNAEKTEQEIKTLFLVLDMSKTGFIDYNEFIAANLPKNIYHANDDLLKSAFRIFDLSNTGKVSRNELKEIFGRHQYYQKKPDAYWEDMLLKSDYDKDGVIDFKDFATMINNP